MNSRKEPDTGIDTQLDELVGWAKKLREDQLAARPRNQGGEPVCGCGALLGPDELECAVCPERRKAAERECALTAEIGARLRPVRASLPGWDWARHDHPLFVERVDSPKLRTLAQRWTPTGRGPLLLLGESGIGKTATALAVVHRLISDGERAARAAGTTRCAAFEVASRICWTTAPELIRVRRGHPLGRGECPEWRSTSQARLLVLDELGQEQADPRWLLELLDARYASPTQGLVTLSTSGLTREALEARYGFGAWRRLLEPGGHIVDLYGGTGGE